MSIIRSSLLLGAPAGGAGYSIPRSIRLNSADSAFLSRTPASAGNRKTWTWAGWVKRTTPGSIDHIFNAPGYAVFYFYSDDTLQFDNGGAGSRLFTSQVFRDPSAWYHIVLVLDTTQATASNRNKLYVNGVQVTSFSTAAYPTQNTDYAINNNVAHQIGLWNSQYANFYLADIYFIDGQALTPTSFGAFDATTGVWNPSAYSGSYGTNGFHLPFSDNSAATATALGKDTSGNGNNFTPSNLSVTAGAGNDSLVDSPTNGTASSGGDAGGTVVGNYCTWNAVQSGATLANGNLECTGNNGSAWRSGVATFGVSSGKWYYEATILALGVSNGLGFGVVSSTDAQSATTNFIGDPKGWGCQLDGNAKKIYNGTYTTITSGTYAVSDILMVAFDLDNGRIWFGRNGSWFEGSPSAGTGASFTNLSGTVVPAISCYPSGSSAAANFGQRPFAYAAPAGFKSLNTANLPTPTILAGNTAFDTKLYTGNGSTQTISGLAFSPDLVWIKKRSAAADHNLVDSVRVGTRPYLLYPNLTNAENTTYANSVQSLDTTGFTVGSDSDVNASSASIAAWCWDAGTSTVTNTAGSITSTVRANASAGFSIVTYTGTGSLATVGHGLGAAPQFIIVKARSTTYNWSCYHVATGKDYVINLNTTGAGGSGANSWGSAAPTSTVFGVKDAGPENNGNGVNFVAYCFAPVSGYSSFGSYTGTGSDVFVYTGFRPRWVMIKYSSGSASGIIDWGIWDAARGPYNVNDPYLGANVSDAEATSAFRKMDFVSNGFVLKGSGVSVSGNTYIYAAFAENPFSIARAR